MRSFVKIKSWQNGEIILSFTVTGNSCLCLDVFLPISFNAICENKILAKISEFSVCAQFPYQSEYFNIHVYYSIFSVSENGSKNRVPVPTAVSILC